MSWNTAYGSGKFIVIKHGLKGPASKSAPKFLESVHKLFIKKCTNYFNITYDRAFYYSELRTHSVLLPAIAQISDAILVEHPINKGERSGRVDYFVLSGNQIYLIELKQGWLAYNTANPTNDICSKWQNAIGDLNDISWDDAFSLYPSIPTVAKISLMVTPMYESSNDETVLYNKSYPPDIILEKFTSFSDKLKPKPNWTAIWSLNDKQEQTIQVKSGRFERYPAVALIAYIEGKSK